MRRTLISTNSQKEVNSRLPKPGCHVMAAVHVQSSSPPRQLTAVWSGQRECDVMIAPRWSPAHEDLGGGRLLYWSLSTFRHIIAPGTCILQIV